jgi:hypothetical protein
MNDGNKESTKELLAVFRTLMATAVSVLLVATNLRFSGVLVPSNDVLFFSSMAVLFVSCICCLAMFFIAVPMLYHEQDRIVYQPSIVKVGVGALATFVAALALLVLAQVI